MKQFERDNMGVINELKALADVRAERSWHAQTRAQLFALAQSESLTSSKSPYILSKLVAVPTLAVLVLLAVIGSSAAFAAQSADPDDFLYPLKLATEKIQEGIATTPQAKLELRQKFVQRRFEELDMLRHKVSLEERNITDVQNAIRRNKEAADALLQKIQSATLVQFEKATAETVKQEASTVLTQSDDENTAVVDTATTSPTTQDTAKTIIFDRIDEQIKQHKDILAGVAALASELEEKQKQIINQVLETGVNATTTDADTASTTPAVSVVEQGGDSEQRVATTTPNDEAATSTTDNAPLSDEPRTDAVQSKIQTETTTQSTVETIAE